MTTGPEYLCEMTANQSPRREMLVGTIHADLRREVRLRVDCMSLRSLSFSVEHWAWADGSGDKLKRYPISDLRFEVTLKPIRTGLLLQAED